MRARSTQSTKAQLAASPAAQPQQASNEARMAAVVEAAYILEARTR